MVDTVFAEIELPPADSAWREAMRRRADSARRVLRRHPWAVALLDSRSPGAATLRHHEAVLGVLRTGGFSVEAAVRAFFVVDSYVYGAVLQEVGLPFGGQEGLEQVVDDVADRLDVASHPRLVEVATGYASQQGYDFVEAFDAGLTLILGALHPDEG
nr:TetR/AcrR family transcriptional regulator C-terminal domain-containing protein [Isoptericola halotolerans]